MVSPTSFNEFLRITKTFLERKSKILLKKHKLISENQALRIRNNQPLPTTPNPAVRQITNFGTNTNPNFTRFSFNINRNDMNLAVQRYQRSESIQELDSISNTSIPLSDVY